MSQLAEYGLVGILLSLGFGAFAWVGRRLWIKLFGKDENDSGLFGRLVEAHLALIEQLKTTLATLPVTVKSLSDEFERVQLEHTISLQSQAGCGEQVNAKLSLFLQVELHIAKAAAAYIANEPDEALSHITDAISLLDRAKEI